jgi:Glycosyl transferase family 2
MHYKLTEVELTQPLISLELAAGENGAGVLVRRKGRPIGFLMQEAAAKQTWRSEELSVWIANELKTKIAEEAIREVITSSGPNGSFPSLTVAICTRDRATIARRCLDSLLPLQKAYGFELLVIDNAPSDQATAQLVKELPTVRCALEKYPGLNFARNRAWKEASGELIAYLDDDVVVDRDWVEACKRQLPRIPMQPPSLAW